MASFSVDLDSETLDKAREVAKSQQSSLESLIQQYVAQLVNSPPHSTSLGLFQDEPETVDQMLNVAYQVRRTRHGKRSDTGDWQHLPL
jgi:hypothetical protein